MPNIGNANNSRNDAAFSTLNLRGKRSMDPYSDTIPRKNADTISHQDVGGSLAGNDFSS